jgi:hypothetical protein
VAVGFEAIRPLDKPPKNSQCGKNVIGGSDMIHEVNNANPDDEAKDKDADFAATVCIGADTESGESKSNYPSVAVPTGKIVKLVWDDNS